MVITAKEENKARKRDEDYILRRESYVIRCHDFRQCGREGSPVDSCWKSTPGREDSQWRRPGWEGCHVYLRNKEASAPRVKSASRRKWPPWWGPGHGVMTTEWILAFTHQKWTATREFWAEGVTWADEVIIGSQPQLYLEQPGGARKDTEDGLGDNYNNLGKRWWCRGPGM